MLINYLVTQSVRCTYNIYNALIFKRKRCHCDSVDWSKLFIPFQNKFLATPLQSDYLWRDPSLSEATFRRSLKTYLFALYH